MHEQLRWNWVKWEEDDKYGISMVGCGIFIKVYNALESNCWCGNNFAVRHFFLLSGTVGGVGMWDEAMTQTKK